MLSAAVLLFSIVLLKTYRQISSKELKRRAREGDTLANALYRVVAYNKSLDIFLWFFVGLSAALLFTLFARVTPMFIATFGIASIIWFGFAWLPNTHNTHFGKQLAKFTARPLHIVLETLYPLLNKLEKIIFNHRPVMIHTGLFTKEDLLELLRQQKGQLDNRISKEELLIARNALTFSDLLVRDIYMPKRIMKIISADDSVGPLLLEELHKSGYSRFPVYEGKKDNFVGILHVRSVIKKSARGLVKNNMESKIYYIHEESTLNEALQAFLKTHHHMFLVVNSFEEVVGLVTLEDVLEKIIGKPIIDEFDQYDDLRAVAAKAAAKDHGDNHIGQGANVNKTEKETKKS